MPELLRAAGHDCAHVYELGLGGQPDEQIMAAADRENRILVSADTDSESSSPTRVAPSVIPLRRTDKQADLSPPSFSRISGKSPMISPQVLSS